MQKDAKQEEILSPEILDVMRDLIAAIRVVKIYPPNNPIFSQSVNKAYKALSHFLENAEEYNVGVQKGFFSYRKTSVGKDAQLNRSIAQDLFGKGIREIIIGKELGEQELMELCKALALSPEELAIRSGISTILWEKGVTHVKVAEAGLDEVINAEVATGLKGASREPGEEVPEQKRAAKPQMAFTGRTLVLSDLVSNPEGFGASMLELAMRTKGEHETVEDRLYTLYQEAGEKILAEHSDRQEEMFEGLAKSVLALDSPHREKLVAGKLYGNLDAELLDREQPAEPAQQLPSPLQEIRTGRFTDTWNAQQVAMLLRRSTKAKAQPPSPPPSPQNLVAKPLIEDIEAIARELAEYRPEEMEELRALGSAGMESDIIEAAVRTLIHLLPRVRSPFPRSSEHKDLHLFSGIVHQLEDLLSYLLKKNNYKLATEIIKTLQAPADPEFQPRLLDALKKTATKTILLSTINDMRKHNKDSPEYQAAYAYLTVLDRKATEALLDLLAEEKDRNARLFLLDLLKDVGKNQLVLLGEYIADGRWYVVRNIVSILGESKAEQAIAYLRKAADNENVVVRQEVIKGLMAIGGKKAASLLPRFLRDPDMNVRLTAVHALAEMEGIGQEEAKHLIEVLQELQLKKKDQELTVESIKALGKIGGKEAAEFLKGYLRVKWWKSRQLQEERRTAARKSIEEIMRRAGDGGRTKR